MRLEDYILLPTVAIGITAGLMLLSVIEAVILSRFVHYDWRSLGTSVANLGIHWVLLLVFPYSVSVPVVGYFSTHPIGHIPLNGWQAFLLLFVMLEFCQYWFHRASHRVRWFWIGHSVHHSPNSMNLSVGYRAGSLLRLSGGMIFYVPMYWIGFPPQAVTAAITVNFWWQIVNHCSWIPKLGWLEYWFVTPSAHRVHHGSNPEYLDTNYGSVLIIFDRLFGTYAEERADNPVRYGLVQPQLSYNPLRVEFDPWKEFFCDLRSCRSVRDVIGCFFFPPGWKPAGRAGSFSPAPAAAGPAPALVPVRAEPKK